MVLTILAAVALLAYAALATRLYRAAPSLDELEQTEARVPPVTGLQVGRADREVAEFPLYIGSSGAFMYQQALGLAFDHPVARRLAHAFTVVVLAGLLPVKRWVLRKYWNNRDRRIFFPRLIYRELFGSRGMTQLMNPIALLEDDPNNTTLEARAGSVAAALVELYRQIESGNVVNLTRGQPCDVGEASFLFKRCSGHHELSESRDGWEIPECVEIEPDPVLVVFVGRSSYELRISLEEGVEETRRRLLLGFRQILADHELQGDRDGDGGRLNLCTQVFDQRQPELRWRYRDYFRAVNRAVFTVSLFPDLHPSHGSELSTAHIARPESGWHDKGLQLFVYANGSATVVGRCRNYVMGSTIVKAAAFASQSPAIGAGGAGTAGGDTRSLIQRLEPPHLTKTDREICDSYTRMHLRSTDRKPHIETIPSTGRRHFRRIAGRRVSPDSIFQICLQAAWYRVHGRFPVATEAVYLGHFRNVYSATQELCGTPEMKEFAGWLASLDDDFSWSDAEYAVDERAEALLRAASSHHTLMAYAQQGFMTPNRLLAWFRSLAFTPLSVVVAVISVVPGVGADARVLRWIAGAAEALFGRSLAFAPLDIASSHLPALAGVRAGAIQNCRFDRLPWFFTPDLSLPERMGGMYRPKVLVHYGMYDDHINVSPLYWCGEAREHRTELVQTLKFYLAVCKEMCERPVPRSGRKP